MKKSNPSILGDEQMLEVRNLSVYYRKTPALRNISIHSGENEAVGLVGRNGAGKTTTLKAITGLIKAKSGQILFKDKDLTRVATYKIPRMGISYVPQEGRVFPQLSVKENLLISGLADSGQARIEKAYELFPQLKEREDNLAYTLSGGEKQLLAITRALASDPTMILFDEPTEGLMPRFVNSVKEVIKKAVEAGKSILLAEQNLETVLSLCQRLYIIKRGEIIGEEETDHLELDDLRKHVF